MLEKITIYKYQHDLLQRRIAKLDALEKGGVSNWAMYDLSLAEWYQQEAMLDLMQSVIDDINDVMTEADVDQPAGHGAGYSITFDEEGMQKILTSFAEEYLKLKAHVV